MNEKIDLVSFTVTGEGMAEKIRECLGGSHTPAHAVSGFSLRDWTEAAFSRSKALVFVGAAGIAVRAVAPFAASKTSDPAVICVDELGRYVIPLLSGHLGGANALAQEIAAITGGTAVITTATDLHRAFAVDLWAKKQGLQIRQPERIKTISARILKGETVSVECPWIIKGQLPERLGLCCPGDIVIDYRDRGDAALQLLPGGLTLGLGCRRGISAEQIEAVFLHFCRERCLLPEGICGAATIDLKKNETGLLEFCACHGWPLRFFDAGALAQVAGDFSASSFVKQTVGVDNVCERSAVLSCGNGLLLEHKFSAGGVTFALAMPAPNWDWGW